uniref:DUF674 domain-containing protein n=1 Tax=Oryza brachyantha TaxID=4533 RepID=J3M0Y5_ORYBR
MELKKDSDVRRGAVEDRKKCTANNRSSITESILQKLGTTHTVTRYTNTMSKPNNGGPTVAVKLYIDKEKKKVLFAESDKEFVDVLFSFLTLPLGTAVRLLGKRSQLGCLDELYKSVENLGEDHFQTNLKAMLLRPRNDAESHCDRLKVKIDDTNARAIYVCPNSSCVGDVFSSYPGACKSCNSTLILREKPKTPSKGSTSDSYLK